MYRTVLGLLMLERLRKERNGEDLRCPVNDATFTLECERGQRRFGDTDDGMMKELHLVWAAVAAITIESDEIPLMPTLHN